MGERIPRPRRSFIFTPGLKPEMFPKALASGADMVCIELEDGIAPKDKKEARIKALKLFEVPQAEDGVERILRINSIRERFGMEDILAILEANNPPPSLMMPKVKHPEEVIISSALPTNQIYPSLSFVAVSPVKYQPFLNTSDVFI